MSTSTTRQTRGRSAQQVKESVKSETRVEAKSTRSKSQNKEEEKTVQKSTAKKKVQVTKKTKKSKSTSKESRSKSKSASRSKTPTKSKETIKKITRQSKKETTTKPSSRKSKSSGKTPEKDSWGDTIFNDSDSKEPQDTIKTPSKKRKAEKITQSEASERELSLKESKKAKKTKEVQNKTSTSTATAKSKSAAAVFQGKTTDLSKSIKFIIQLDIALAEVDLAITRQVLVSTEVTFARLARIIVAAMGWKGYHDWKFVINKDEIYSPDTENAEEGKVIASDVFLEEYTLKVGQEFVLIYNLECNWKHVIKITEISEFESKGRYERGDVTFNPVLTEGKNACPPDEIEGGAKEYNNMLKVLKAEEPKAEYEEIVEIYGRDYNPYEFNKKTVNNLLANFPYDDEFDITKCEHDDIFKW